MFQGRLHLLKTAWLLAGTTLPLLAGNFAPPAEGPVAFRRDRVPLDSDAMGKLSVQVSNLADGVSGKTAAERRGAAQMLALAVALDPANARARTLIDQFQNERHRADSDGEKASNSRARIWQTIGWLESPEAGKDGQALAACLKDVVVISDPQDPRSEKLLAAGEGGAWKGWIPPATAYEEAKVSANPDPDEGQPKPPASAPGILLNEATVMTPLWKRTDSGETVKWSLAISPMHMAGTAATVEEAATAPFAITFGSKGEEGPASALAPPVLRALALQHGKLPAGCSVHIDSPELEVSLLSKKKQSISGAAAVLASAAVTGREPDATVIGLIDATGAFKLPTGFWDQLRAVSGGDGGRLVLPAEAATYLPSMLAMENPKFFMDHEVLLASNLKELLDLTAKKQDDSMGRLSTQFREIREKMGAQPLGQYVANSFIRRRLAEIGQAAPHHYSAKMLAIQGAGNRPTFVTRPVLVSELRRAIEPMQWVITHGDVEFTAAEIPSIGTTFETCRAAADQLLRYADKADRPVVDQTLEMITLLRPLDRAAKARPDPYSSITPTTAPYLALRQAYTAVMTSLGGAGSEAESALER